MTKTLLANLKHRTRMLSFRLRNLRRTIRRAPRSVLWLWRHDCRVIAHIHKMERYSHSWFEEAIATRILFEDPNGVLWWRAWGVLRAGIATRKSLGGVVVDRLGGDSWRQSGRYFVCEHATCWAEIERLGPNKDLEPFAGILQ